MATLYLIYAFIFGAIVGSFLNVCIYRLPRGISIVWPGSHCPSCGAPIRWFYNIPLVGFIILRARCASCGHAISPVYPMVETASSLAAVGAVARFGPTLEAISLFLFAALLIVCIAADIQTKILPDEITLGGLGAILLLGWISPGVDIRVKLWGAVAGSFMFLLILLLYYFFRGYHGMGFGDVKMMAMIGAFVGFPHVLPVVVCASILGLLWGIFTILVRRKSMRFALPFGAFLGAAALIAAYFPGVMTALAGNAIPD